MGNKKVIDYAEDDRESVSTLVKIRAPSLVIGLFLGFLISFVTSRFEEVLSANVSVAFFIPFIVYIADALGTQTEAIYSRDLKTGKAKFSKYLAKELLLGIIFGVLFSIFSSILIILWLSQPRLALSVGIATFLAVSTAPLVALIVTELLQLTRRDPAAGSGPIATVIQDMISVIIYGIVCSIIL